MLWCCGASHLNVVMLWCTTSHLNVVMLWCTTTTGMLWCCGALPHTWMLWCCGALPHLNVVMLWCTTPPKCCGELNPPECCDVVVHYPPPECCDVVVFNWVPHQPRIIPHQPVNISEDYRHIYCSYCVLNFFVQSTTNIEVNDFANYLGIFIFSWFR